LNTVFGESWVGQQRFTSTAEIDALHAALRIGPNVHVLDLGSGLGGPAIRLAQDTGCQVTGIDPAVEHAHHAQTAAEAAGVAERVRFVAGDLTEADFPTAAFDAIVSHDAFVTIPDKARLLACCRRWLRPSGRLATTLIVDLVGLQREADRPDLLAWPIPTADGYRILAAQAGLRILSLDDLTPSFREIGARWRGALLVWESALVPALGYDNWTMLRATIGRLAEWATQGVIGHVRLVAVRDAQTSANIIVG
jgi:cyclopropane fatty-acyl-phospholipid synthase-like methyltransferase